MKIAPQFEIERVASKDMTRTHLCHVHLDAERRVAVATNGHALVRVPVAESENDTTGPVTVDAVAAMRKAKVGCHANGVLALDNGVAMPRPSDVKFPPYEQVIPEYRRGDAGTLTFGINAKLLWEVAQAIGAKRTGIVEITVKLPKAGEHMLDPVVVQGGCDAGLGVLMPARV